MRNFRFLTLSDQPLPNLEGIEIDFDLAPDILHEGEPDGNTPQSGAQTQGSSAQERLKRKGDEQHTDIRMNLRKRPRVDYQQLHNPFSDDEEVHKETLTTAEVVYTVYAQSYFMDEEPHTLAEAKRSPEWPNWEKAIRAELGQLNDMGTWELTEAPLNVTPIGNKWVLLWKYNKQGELIKYKARLVIKGCAQQPG